ncbi:rhodanese-like domain-containing protein [Hahella sp. CR1]|uniref:sulfurtransferase n=1 Tax=Hahella sp. CR1 TaxID=2992807 RepID=UPI0024419D00|nr:rhodanese-like domain-containing protein [Hahella sp. CR1]MDG9671130.1 rhodanese-like domain-containing protein [Hahella sp. CR1]
MANTLDSLPLILEPEQLEPLLGSPGLILVDLCRTENYQAAHLPGAIHIPPGATQYGRPPAPGLLPDKSQLQAIVQHIGLRHDSHVVVYDDEGGGWAGRMIWLLDSIGFQRYSYLNGGLVAWHDEGRPLTREEPSVTPSDYEIQLRSEPTATLDQLQAELGDSALAIWDARSPQEYQGVRQTAMRNGHIPGAVNYEWTRAMDPSAGLRLRDLTAIKEELEALGLNADKRIVTHCQSHHRSGLTYLLGKALGFNMRAYAGSWGEWGNHPDTPIDQP